MKVISKYYQKYVLNTEDYVPNQLSWKDCTRYFAGFLIKTLLLKQWKSYEEDGKWTYEFTAISEKIGLYLEFGKDENGEEIDELIQQYIQENGDHYPDDGLMQYVGSFTLTDQYIDRDVLECIGIVNDLFIGRRDSYEMYDQEYCTDQLYNPSINWPLPRSGPPYGRRPYLQGQDPARSNALIWVPLPILRFAFFAKEVARFGRPFEGMRAVAQEQLDTLDFTQIHGEYRLILKKVLELEDTPESRNALDILSNNLFLGEKPLTQAWVEGPEELPWIR